MSPNMAAHMVVGTKMIPLQCSSGEIAGIGGSILGAHRTEGSIGAELTAPGQGNASYYHSIVIGVHIFNGGAANSKD